MKKNKQKCITEVEQVLWNLITLYIFRKVKMTSILPACAAVLTTLFHYVYEVHFVAIQWNLIITAIYGPNFSGCYIKVAALQRCKCIESHHLGID